MKPWPAVVIAAVLAPVLGLFSGGSEAAASCAFSPEQIRGSFANAPVVFVGTVVATSNGDREATVRVESIWRGPDLLTYVRISGTPEPGGHTDVDRTYQAGKRYLFVPVNSSSPFQDNNCTATQLYTTALASQAPSEARPPQPGGDPSPPRPNLPWIAIGVLMLLVTLGLAGWRLRPRGQS